MAIETISERNFLHDISSPLMTIQLSVENVLAMLEESDPAELPECIKMVATAGVQIRRAAEMIRARRETLINEGKLN